MELVMIKRYIRKGIDIKLSDVFEIKVLEGS